MGTRAKKPAGPKDVFTEHLLGAAAVTAAIQLLNNRTDTRPVSL